MFLESLPLSPNGKLDRKALPAPDPTRAELKESYTAPRTATEEVLAGIWAELLKVEKVGIRDNFFDLGGHSLLAVRLTNAIQRHFQTPIRVAHVFEAPTVEQFALLLQDPRETSWLSLVALNSQGSRTPFFWVHGEASDAFLPRYLGPDQPLYGLRHQSEDGRPALYRTVEEIAAHYLEEICSVQPQGPYLLGGYCFGALVALEMAQRLQAQQQAIDLLVLLDPPYEETPDGDSATPQTPSLALLSNCRHDLRVIASLRPGEKWCYVLKKTQERAVQAMRLARDLVQNIAQEVTLKTSLMLGVPIPVALRSSYILEIYDNAISSYTTRRYEGNVVLFSGHSYSQSLRRQWFDLYGAELKIHEMQGDHHTVLEEPNVGIWAKELKTCLDRREHG